MYDRGSELRNQKHVIHRATKDMCAKYYLHETVLPVYAAKIAKGLTLSFMDLVLDAENVTKIAEYMADTILKNNFKNTENNA